MTTASLELHPIGVVHTPYVDRYRAPRQPGAARVGAEGTIELFAGHNFEQALADLAGVERIWVIYWFHRNRGWKPMVLPPRGPRQKRGVFATRSPHRPNPLGLSLLRLLEVRGRTLRVADVDLLDGTPVFDLKPYLPYAEAFPDARAGWLDAVIADEQAHGAARFDVRWTDAARAQTAWLAARGVDLESVAESVLAGDPLPHPYKRIEPHAESGYQLAVKSWRLRFALTADTVLVTRVASGYAPGALVATPAPTDAPLHLAFAQAFPG